MSGYFMFYNNAHQHEVHQAQSEQIAWQIMGVATNNGRIKLFRCGQTAPSALERVSIMEVDNQTLAAEAIVAYPKMKGKTPETRAKQAFKQAFDRPADTKGRIWEAEALSNIVMYSSG